MHTAVPDTGTQVQTQGLGLHRRHFTETPPQPPCIPFNVHYPTSLSQETQALWSLLVLFSEFIFISKLKTIRNTVIAGFNVPSRQVY